MIPLNPLHINKKTSVKVQSTKMHCTVTVCCIFSYQNQFSSFYMNLPEYLSIHVSEKPPGGS